MGWLSVALAGGILAASAEAAEFVQFIHGAVPSAACVDCGACEVCGQAECGCGPAWRVGFDFLLAKPHFERNLAYTTVRSDGVSNVTISDTEFDYDFELAPRIWAHYESSAGVGIRGSYWWFDQSAAAEVVQPPANGFGFISHPRFGDSNIPLTTDVIIASTIPTDTFATVSALDAYTLDLEITKRGTFCNWDLLAGAGVRYARIEQQYLAELRSGGGVMIGGIDYVHEQQGFGPTLSLETRRGLGAGFAGFALTRASLLMGESTSELIAGEDLDLATPIITSQSRARDDVLPIAELVIGAEWRSGNLGFAELLVRSAFEAQWWGGVGSASSEEGDLGFLGGTIGVGLMR